MTFQDEFLKTVPKTLIDIIQKRDGSFEVLTKLKSDYSPDQIVTKQKANKEQRIWELIGLYYKANQRYIESISIFKGLYEHMLLWQKDNQKWVHKGMPLVWISDIYSEMRMTVLSKRYLMLTLVEDTIRENGKISPELSGVYFRLVWNFGMADFELDKYQQKIYNIYQRDTQKALFPEFIIQNLDNEWMIELPSPNEVTKYIINPFYIDELLKDLSNGNGKSLENVASYLLSCMPGCKTNTRLRQTGNTTDYDVVCSIDGFILDFRSELGRYFVCECKDWDKPANFTSMAKFCRILTSIKSNFGILFSKNGITGQNEELYAEREQLKVFQDSGIIIVVIDLKDIDNIKSGQNLINLLRTKYEKVRLDLE
jgi:hypothetical protein